MTRPVDVLDTLRGARTFCKVVADARQLDAAEALAEIDAAHAALNTLLAASDQLGRWMAAALDAPSVCKEMKGDIEAWLDALARCGGGQ